MIAMAWPQWGRQAKPRRGARPEWDNAMHLAGLVALSGLVGCASPVRILEPDDQPKTQAIERVTVQLTSDYRAGSFHATLNGRDVTASWFAGCGLTNGPSTCSAALPAFEPHDNRLRVEGDFLSRPLFATTSATRTLRPASVLFSHDELGRCHQPGPVGGVGGSGSSGSTGSGSSTGGGPTPGFTQQCTPQFRVLAPEGQDRRIWLLLPAAPTRPATITVTPGSSSIRLQTTSQVGAAGAPVAVTIPVTDRRASFWIRGIAAGTGPISLTAEAPGYARAIGEACVPAPSTGRC